MVTPRYNLEEELEKIVDCDSNFTLTSCGVTRSQTNIPVLLHQNAYPRVEGQFNLLLLSGTSGTTDDVRRGLEVLKSYLRNLKTLPKKFSHDLLHKWLTVPFKFEVYGSIETILHFLRKL